MELDRSINVPVHELLSSAELVSSTSIIVAAAVLMQPNQELGQMTAFSSGRPYIQVAPVVAS
jgi:hypothetical protein